MKVSSGRLVSKMSLMWYDFDSLLRINRASCEMGTQGSNKCEGWRIADGGRIPTKLTIRSFFAPWRHLSGTNKLVETGL